MGSRQNVPKIHSIPNSGSGTITLSGIVNEELQLQVVQHLYSTSLVVLKKDTLLRLQKEQFYSISLILQTRVSPETLLDLEILLSQEGIGISTYSRVIDHISPVGIQTFVGSAVVKSVSIHQKELTYTSLVEHTQISNLHTLHSHKGVNTTSCLGNWFTQISTTHLIMVSTGTLVSKQVLPSLLGRVLEESTEILALLPQGSFQNILVILQYSNFMVVQYPEQTHLYQLTVLSTFLVLVQMETVLSTIKLELEIYLVSSLVQKRDSFQRPSLVLDLSYSTSRQLHQTDQSKPLVTTETTKIQAHLVKSLSVRKVVSSQKKVSSGFTEQMVLEDIFTKVLLKTNQQHSPKLVVDLYLQSVEYQKPRHPPNWLLEPPYSMERQKVSFCKFSREYCNTYTIWNRNCSQRIRIRWIWNSYTPKRYQVVTGVKLSHDGSGTFSVFGGAAESTVEPSAARAILTEISGVAETRYFQVFQDFVPSGTLTLSGELTHPDIDYTPAYTGIGNYNISGTAGRSHVFREIGVGIATFSGSIVRFTADDLEGTVLFDTKGASALTKSSLRILRRRQRSRHIWYYYNIWYWYHKRNTELWILWRR